MDKKIETRLMKPEDLDEVLRTTVEAFEGVSFDHNIEKMFPQAAENSWKERKSDSTRKHLGPNPDQAIVATVDGIIAGYISFETDPASKIAHICNLAVDKTYRNIGVSNTMFEAVLKHLKELGMKSCRIETLEQNDLCLQYYPRLGFDQIATQKMYIRML
jgi:ribosomal protein S18 acetylase RimI-like enzyme